MNKLSKSQIEYKKLENSRKRQLLMAKMVIINSNYLKKLMSTWFRK